jgi:hypothetical protein
MSTQKNKLWIIHIITYLIKIFKDFKILNPKLEIQNIIKK